MNTVINNISNRTFKGYQNVFGNYTQDADAISGVLTIQLNNNDTNDLEVYKSIKEGLPNGAYSGSDILTLSYFKNKNIPNGSLLINNCKMLNGEKIKYIQENYQNYFKDYNDFLEQRTFLMKCNSFIANLTKRIANDNKLIYDSNLGYVSAIAHKIFGGIIGDNENAFNYIKDGLINKREHTQKIALKFNQAISDNLAPFFK